MKTLYVDTDNNNMLKVQNSNLKFSFESKRELELSEARNEMKAFLKHRHVNQGESLVTSFGSFTRVDFYTNHLCTCYYFVSERGEQLRIEL